MIALISSFEPFLPHSVLFSTPHTIVGISLVEWPERLGNTNIPADRLDINIQIEGSVEEEEIRGSGQKSNINNDDEGEEDDKPRIMTLSPHGPIWEQRLQMILAEGYVDDLLL